MSSSRTNKLLVKRAVIETNLTSSVLSNASKRGGDDSANLLYALAAISLLSAITCFKRLFSTKYKSDLIANSLFLHWSNHRHRYPENISLVELNYRSMTRFYSYKRPLWVFVKLIALSASVYKEIRSEFGRNNRISLGQILITSFDFLVIRDIFEESRPKVVHTSGTICRRMLLVGYLCQELNVEHHAHQHGKFRLLEGIQRVRVSCVHLFYPEDQELVDQYFIPMNSCSIEVRMSQREPTFKRVFKESMKLVVYACNPNHFQENINVIDFIIKNIESDVCVIINPHPRENMNDYKKKYKDIRQVQVSIDKYANPAIFICRPSSIAVEAAIEELNLVVYLSALDRHESYMDRYKMLVVSDLDSLRTQLLHALPLTEET